MTESRSNARDIGRRLHRLGFSFLPVEGKSPAPGVRSWKPWQHRPPTAEELRALPWQTATGCGIISGPAGVVCIDIDGAEDERPLRHTLETLGLPPEYPWTVRTPGKGGGFHVWTLCPDLTPEQTSKGKLVGPLEGCKEVELRAFEHYSLAPGSQHPSGSPYVFLGGDWPEEPPATVEPERLLAVTNWKRQDEDEKAEAATPPAGPADISHRYLETALQGEADTVRRSTEPGRNEQLNASAFALGTLAHLGLDQHLAGAELTEAALACGLEPREIRATFKSGWEAGTREPRRVELLSDDRSTTSDTDTDADTKPAPGLFLDWSEFWNRDHDEADYVYPDILARGRGHALWASHKAGKSLLAAYMAAKMATGTEPLVVVYLDYEMSEADVLERLEDMGYGPETDLSRLRYALLPPLTRLDTAEGAEALMEVIDAVQADWPEHHLVVILDTISRAVAGPENDADTIRDFWTHTGTGLKRRGCTWARLDHGGKDASRGARGTSGKGDDVDVVWKLTPMEGGIRLERDLSRMRWIPERVMLRIAEEPLRYEPVSGGYPLGTTEAAELLDELEIPLEASCRAARDALKDAGQGKRMEVVTAALRWRRERREVKA